MMSTKMSSTLPGEMSLTHLGVHVNNAVCLTFAVPTLVQCTVPLINDIANDFYVTNQ